MNANVLPAAFIVRGLASAKPALTSPTIKGRTEAVCTHGRIGHSVRRLFLIFARRPRSIRCSRRSRHRFETPGQAGALQWDLYHGAVTVGIELTAHTHFAGAAVFRHRRHAPGGLV